MTESRGYNEPDLFSSAFAALPGNVALINGNGTIIAENDSWKRFAPDNRSPAAGFEGWNHLSVCRSALSDAGPSLARSLEALLAREREQMFFEYPCHGVDGQHWSLLEASRFGHAGEVFAVVSHHDITRRRMAEMGARELAERDPLTGLYRRHACIGTSVFPEDGRDADSLLFAADEAMYRAIHDGAAGTARARGAAGGPGRGST